MIGSPVFLTVDHVLTIHRRVIDEFGGDPALRDRGLLESAVMMPAAQFGGGYLHDGIPAMAAGYLFHICKNHSFVDGNKRTALATAARLASSRRRASAQSERLLRAPGRGRSTAPSSGWARVMTAAPAWRYWS